MKNFLYYTPTRVVFGKGAENDTGKLIKECGGKKNPHPLRKRKCYTYRTFRQDNKICP